MAESCARQVAGLRRRGIRVEVIAFTDSETRFAIRSEARDNGWDHHLSRSARPGPAGQQAWALAAERARKTPFQGVVGFGAGWGGFLAVTYAAWLGIPSLVLVRGNDFDQAWFDPAAGFRTREALARADRIGVVAPDMGRRIQALFPGKDVRFIPNGVDPDVWEPFPADLQTRDDIRTRLANGSKKIFGLFGELKYKKGVPFWLSALRDTGRMDQAALLVVGRRLDEELEQILDDPALAPVSLRLPFVPRDQLAGLYAACDYVVLPSFFEGLPNVLLEAMASGVAPLTSDAGAMAELVRDGETGFLFPAHDRRAAAEATLKALTQPEEDRRAMGARAREWVRTRFSPEREIETLLEALDLGRGG
jgi:glycosyltransferase involved in cell wall biosynthesis